MKNQIKYFFLSLILVLSQLILTIPLSCTLGVFAQQATPTPVNPYSGRSLTELRTEYQRLDNLIRAVTPRELLPNNLVTAYQNARIAYNANQNAATRQAFITAIDNYVTHLTLRSNGLQDRLSYYQLQLQVIEVMLVTLPRQGERPLDVVFATNRKNELNRLIPQYQNSLSTTNELIQSLERQKARVSTPMPSWEPNLYNSIVLVSGPDGLIAQEDITGNPSEHPSFYEEGATEGFVEDISLLIDQGPWGVP